MTVLTALMDLKRVPQPHTGGVAPLMNRIREMILSGELSPGQRVTEEALAERARHIPHAGAKRSPQFGDARSSRADGTPGFRSQGVQ